MKAVFLDRDGTINVELPNYLTDLRKLKIFKESFKAIRLFNKHQFKTIVITNQGCVEKGLIKEKKLQKINDKLKQKLGEKNARIDSIYYCPHTKEAQCECRKPNIGLLKQAARDHKINFKKSFFIGDRLFDIEAGRASGCGTILVLTGAGKETLEQLKTINEKPDFIAAHILEAAEWIVRTHSWATSSQ